MSQPHYGDGVTYSGECICCGRVRSGQVTRSTGRPYLASADPFGAGKPVKVIMVKGESGVHEIPVASAKAERS